MTGNSTSKYNFLEDTGPVGAYIKSSDWSDHPIGTFEEWPNSLHVTLNLMLSSKLPMVLFWGTDFFCFYNNAYIPFLDSNNHLKALGKKGKNVWPQSWEIIKTRIDREKNNSNSNANPGKVKSYDELIRSNEYQAVRDQKGNITGFLVICLEKISANSKELKTRVSKNNENNILEQVKDAFYEIDKDWIVTNWNNKAEKLLGIQREEILGKNFWETFPLGKKLRFYPEYKKVMTQSVSTSFEEYYDPCGRWFNFSAYPSRKGIFVYFRDITEQRRLRLINQRTEQISGVAGWEYDVATQKVFLTPKAYDIYGIPISEPITLETNKKLFDEESLSKIDEALNGAIENQKSYKLELTLNRADGEERVIEIHGFPQIEHGKVTKLYGTLKDITQRKIEKEELKKANKKLKTALKIGQMGYWTHDLVKDMGDWSEEVLDIWEVDPEEFVPTFENLVKTIHPDDRHKFTQSPGEVFPRDKFITNEHRIITPEGKTKWVFQRITLHRDEDGNPQWLEGIAQDITEKKRAGKRNFTGFKRERSVAC